MKENDKFSLHGTLPEMNLKAATPALQPAGEPPPEDILSAVLMDSRLSEGGRSLLERIQGRFGLDSKIWENNFPKDPIGNKQVIPRYFQRRVEGERSDKFDWLQSFLTDEATSGEIQREWLEEGFLSMDPKWLDDLLLREKAQVARVFLLSGNINDYAYDPAMGYRPLQRMLVDTLLEFKEVVLQFSLSNGLMVHYSNPEQPNVKLSPELSGLAKSGGLKAEQPVVPQVCQIFDYLRRWLDGLGEAMRRGVGIIFEKTHLLFPEASGDMQRNFLVDTLLNWSISPRFFHSPHCLILLAESLEDVSNDLRAQGGKIEQIDIPRPSRPDHRLKFLLPMLSPQSSMKETRFSFQTHGLKLEGYEGKFTDQLRQLAYDTAGLTLMGIEDLLQEIALTPSRVLTQGKVMEGKRERLRQESGGLLEVITPRKTLDDIGGYAALKERIREVIRAINHRHDPLVRSTVPMGMLFLGPPGTGKTITAEALAKESNISLVKMGDFRGMYVGQSERNFSRILNLIEALNPVIVFMDELDQSEGSRGESGDSGVGKRIFGKLLQFMSNTAHRGEILWIGASNRPDIIDAAIKRPGRFDLILPFLLPDADSRKDILAKLIQSKIKDSAIELQLKDSEDYAFLTDRTEGYSGAEIEAIVSEAIRRIIQKSLAGGGTMKIDRALFEEVFSQYIPPDVRDLYRGIEDMVLREISFLDLLPEQYRERRKNLPPRPMKRP